MRKSYDGSFREEVEILAGIEWTDYYYHLTIA
jgi:hypothetical protein